MPTVSSTSSPYCTPAQFQEFVDVTILGDLVNDYGDRQDSTELLTDTKIETALMSASGMIEMAAMVGERYQVEDLEAIRDATGTAANANLAWMTAWLAVERLLGRRNPATEKFPEIEEAHFMLVAIRDGTRIFQFEENAEAGFIKIAPSTGFNTRPMPTSPCRAGRFFGIRGKYLGDRCCGGNTQGCC